MPSCFVHTSDLSVQVPAGYAKGPSMTGRNGNELMATVGKKKRPEICVVPRVGDQQEGWG